MTNSSHHSDDESAVPEITGISDAAFSAFMGAAGPMDEKALALARKLALPKPTITPQGAIEQLAQEDDKGISR